MKSSATNRFPLLRRFSITSVAAMLVTAAILIFLYRQDQFAEHEEISAQNNEKTAAYLVHALDDRINALVVASNGFNAQALQPNPEIGLFADALEKVNAHDIILKLKIYNLSGTTIFSTVRDEIGGTSQHPEILAKALSGEVAHHMEFRDTFLGTTGERHDIHISSVYLPLVHAGKHIGVFEIYADVSPFYKHISANTVRIPLLVFSVFAALYAALFFFLRRTDRAIAEWQSIIVDSEERFRKITGAAQDAIIMMGADQRISFWNAAAERIFGYTAAEATGQELHTLIAPVPARASFAQSFSHFQETGEGAIIGKVRELTAQRKGGEEFPVELSVSATQFGGQWHAIGIVRDVSERKRNEDALSTMTGKLRDSKKLLDSIVEHIPVMVFVKRASDLCFEMFNLAGEKLLGYSRSDLLGKGNYDFWPKDQGDWFTAADRKVLASHEVTEILEEPIKTASGETRYLHTWKVALRDESGEPAHLLGISIDITERKQAEESLRQLSLAVEQSPNSIIITDLDANIEYANAAFVKTTGYSLPEVIGKNPRLLHSGKTPRATYDDLWAHLTRGEMWKGEFINRRKDGSEYIESVLFSPVRQPDGRVTNYLAIKEDITEFKQAQEALRLSREHLHRLLNSMAEGAYGVDTNGNCTFANQAFLKILGYQNENEVLGEHTHELIHHSHADGSPYPERECKVYFAYRLNQVSNVSDEVFWRKDGVAIPVEYWSHPIETDGVVTGAIVTFVVITERKLAQAMLTEQLEELSRWQAATSGREGRILELKHEINELLAQSGNPPRYPSAE